VRRDGGVVARLGSWLRDFGGSRAAAEEVRPIPVSAEIPR
jgi:hypothetical protein